MLPHRASHVALQKRDAHPQHIGRPCREDFGEGRYIFRITEETGMVDINAAPDVLLRKIIENRGVKAGDIGIIIDSIMDEKDPDDLYRLSSAKSRNYQSL